MSHYRLVCIECNNTADQHATWCSAPPIPLGLMSVTDECADLRARSLLALHTLAAMKDCGAWDADTMKRVVENVKQCFGPRAVSGASLLRKPGPPEPGCHCKPGCCMAPRAHWCRDVKKRDAVPLAPS